MIAGASITGPAGSLRHQLSLPACTGYIYEVHGNPTLADLEWKALPFALSATGALDRHHHTATADGALNLFVNRPADPGYYKVTFRVPGANAGTP